jgi:hypothetical protein
MIRERVLTISTLLALMALSGTAYAGPGITDKSYWPNEVGPSSYSRAPQTEPDRYRARAMQRGAPAAQVAPEGNSGQYGCRYSGGPKYPMTCSTRP